MNRLRSLSRSRTRRLGLAGLAVMAVSVIAIGCNRTAAEGTPAPGGAAAGGGRAGGRGGRGGAQPVVTAKVAQKNMPLDVPAVGNVEAFTTISVRSQITGQIQQSFFAEGDVVKKGGLLFKIDPRPLQSALDQSLANETRDQALLSQSEAQLARDAANAEYQQLTAERQAKLAASGIISKDAAEQVRSAADAIASTVTADKAAVESAKAQLAVQKSATDSARVQLGYTDINSPIDGKTGNNTVKVGNLATQNQELVTITQLQPVYVTFTVPAVHLPTIKKHMNGNDKLPVVAIPQDEDKTPADGTLIFVDNLVDSATDTIKLKAVFPNTDRRLWPGQFTKVNLRLSTLMDATVVPSQAVQTGQDGQYVFVVKADSTVEQRPIVVAQRVGEDVVIDKGVKPGETIVTEGQLRLENGTRVQSPDAAAGGQGGRGGRGGGRGRQGGDQGQGAAQSQGQGAGQGQRQGGQGAGQGQGQGGNGRGQQGGGQ